MSQYHIIGGAPLYGQVALSGAKNLASKLILASLLTRECCQLSNVPAIGEIDIALALVEGSGAKTTHNDGLVTIEATSVHSADVRAVTTRNRLSILLIGPLLFRTGSAHVPPVTGDQIGTRPVGFHIDALQSLGATITQTADGFTATAQQLHGCAIELPYPSVGATETVLLTATWAQGQTVLTGAAVEPEILALIEYLQNMGAEIQVDISSRRITIQGVSEFHAASQRVLPDRLEAVSYASAALATKGDVMLLDARETDLHAYLDFCDRIGAGVEHRPDGIRFFYKGPLQPTNFETAVHPGFMADWQQPSVVVLALAAGTSYVHETVYEDRLRFTADLVRMGAQITISSDCYGAPCRFVGEGHPHSALINGPASLTATDLAIPDIRAGMAHVIAALVAKGTSRLSGIHHLDRGYGPSLQTKLVSLGATMKRVDE